MAGGSTGAYWIEGSARTVSQPCWGIFARSIPDAFDVVATILLVAEHDARRKHLKQRSNKLAAQLIEWVPPLRAESGSVHRLLWLSQHGA